MKDIIKKVKELERKIILSNASEEEAYEMTCITSEIIHQLKQAIKTGK